MITCIYKKSYSLDSQFSLKLAFKLDSRAVARGFKLRLATGSQGYLLTGLYDIVLKEGVPPSSDGGGVKQRVDQV